MTTTEQLEGLRNLLRQCRPILRLSGVAASAQAGHMTGKGIASLDALEALRARVDAALAGPSHSASDAERDPRHDPQPGDVLRDLTYNRHTKRQHEDDYVVTRRYVDSAGDEVVEWAAPSEHDPRELHLDEGTLDDWRDSTWSGGVVRVAGGGQ